MGAQLANWRRCKSKIIKKKQQNKDITSKSPHLNDWLCAQTTACQPLAVWRSMVRLPALHFHNWHIWLAKKKKKLPGFQPGGCRPSPVRPQLRSHPLHLAPPPTRRLLRAVQSLWQLFELWWGVGWWLVGGKGLHRRCQAGASPGGEHRRCCTAHPASPPNPILIEL